MNQVKEFLEYIFNAIKIWIIVQPWEQGLRVRKGKQIKLLTGGWYFRIPYVDSVYIQETRLRVVGLALQTLTSKDNQTITLNSSIGYQITSIEKLYNTLYHPETTISNMAMAVIAEYIFTKNVKEICAADIEAEVIQKLNKNDYGLSFEYFKITNFAVVKTFRLIQDNQTWIDEGLDMNKKK